MESFYDGINLADIDNDDDLDVISVRVSGIYWQNNIDGLGDFGTPKIILDWFWYGEISIVSTDIDNDGDIDLVASYLIETGQGIVVWFENLNWQGNFSSSHIIDTVIDPKSIYVADLNNDGKMDVLAIDGSKLIWYENIGQGAFISSKTISTNVMGAYSLYAEDLDNDGHIDILCSILEEDKIIWCKNDGNGNF